MKAVHKDIKSKRKLFRQSYSYYFETFWWLSKFYFHHKWKKASPLRNQSQQRKNKIRFGSSLRGEMVRASVGASCFGWFLGGCGWFLLVEAEFVWFQVVCINLTACRIFISLLYSWSHVNDWGDSTFLFKVKQQEKKYRCIVT